MLSESDVLEMQIIKSDCIVCLEMSACRKNKIAVRGSLSQGNAVFLFCCLCKRSLFVFLQVEIWNNGEDYNWIRHPLQPRWQKKAATMFAKIIFAWKQFDVEEPDEICIILLYHRHVPSKLILISLEKSNRYFSFDWMGFLGASCRSILSLPACGDIPGVGRRYL